MQTPTRGEATSQKDGAPRAVVAESRGDAFGLGGETRTGLTAPEVIALGLFGLLVLVALGSLLLILAFI